MKSRAAPFALASAAVLGVLAGCDASGSGEEEIATETGVEIEAVPRTGEPLMRAENEMSVPEPVRSDAPQDTAGGEMADNGAVVEDGTSDIR
ncbi:MAG: hypothetical protein WA979_00510 [Pacificimonas sp.]